MTSRASYRLGTILIIVGAALAWVGFFTQQRDTYVRVVFLVAGGSYLFFTRRRRA